MNYYVYILTNNRGNVMYVRVINDFERRLYELKHELIDGFTKKYPVYKLVYYESTPDVNAAIAREKQIKGWNRKRKNALVMSMNPEWQDLSEGWSD